MCLSIPAKITEIKDGNIAIAEVGGACREIGLDLIEDPKVGEYVLIHTGYAIEKIDEEEAMETLRYLREMAEMIPDNNEIH